MNIRASHATQCNVIPEPHVPHKAGAVPTDCNGAADNVINLNNNNNVNISISI